MKAYTDLEQSKKLAEILPLESADMHYQYVLPKSDKIRYNPILGNPIDALGWYNKGYTHFGKSPLALSEYCIPCWSLAALLDLIPYRLDDSSDFTIEKWEDGYLVTYGAGCYKYGNELIDTCYEMIIKLNEQKLL